MFLLKGFLNAQFIEIRLFLTNHLHSIMKQYLLRIDSTYTPTQ
jgi:hypothetical protein